MLCAAARLAARNSLEVERRATLSTARLKFRTKDPLMPTWLHDLSLTYLLLGCACAAVIAYDELERPQRMWIMNVVWPTTALFGAGWILWQYFKYGRVASQDKAPAVQNSHAEARNVRSTPFPIMVANGTLHCGSGCALGDLVAEWLVYAVPAIAVAFGWHSIFREQMFAVWVVDYLFAYAFGIGFQYFTIAPMRGLSVGQGLLAAIKADTLSLTAWQVGMYGFMAFAHFGIFEHALGQKLQPASVEFWFMMQVAMLCGFITSYPVNWWLIKSGIKEKM
jgi:hypothetical protein